ncbi:MAG: hypothetical protein GXY34_10640 [Syntrophomonadaceae bacterium]|nr:hypothetical protein [Syntrophomonadaceae bacterium]
MSSDLATEKKVSYGVPAVLYFLMIAILAGMYYFAAFVMYANPEKVVNAYYDAYFAGDFKTVSEHTSVFLAAQALPQYGNLSPATLVAERREIEKDIALIMEQNADTANYEGLSIEVMPEYTRKGESTAIVVYKVLKDGKELGMEAAIMDKETKRLRLFQTTPIVKESLAEIKQLDMKEMDKNLATMLAE